MPTKDAGLDAEVRRAADRFLMAVSVAAEERGVEPAVLTEEVLRDSLARLTEQGVLGTSGPPDGSGELQWDDPEQS